jgi:hypothetical protein
MAEHPYKSLPPYCFWRRSVAEPAMSDVDPVIRPKFKISQTDKVVTAGSCFAQHIARYLSQSGFSYFVTETAHPLIQGKYSETYNYGVFSARYGNVYTSRQLLQLLKRAYSVFQPSEDMWVRKDGRVFDPFRPEIEPHGFSSIPEYVAHRRQHLAAVRRAIEEMDIFVFTLGLTETWISKIDGAAYPLCPGVAAGTFDADKYAFVNLGASDVIADMREAIALIRTRNPGAKFILTVSPVPLIATAEDRSVLVSTTYSKAVLRVAAEELSQGSDDIAYFPSFEIITGNHARGSYFGSDLRDVTEAGVAHVMRLFMKHYAHENAAPGGQKVPQLDQKSAAFAVQMDEVARVVCEEEMLDVS